MIALRKHAATPGVELSEVPRPAPVLPTDVIVEVAATGICGSDLHIDEWFPDYAFLIPALPVTLGHEFSGRIVEVGAEVPPSAIGKRVVVKPSVACGVCIHCTAGDPDDCGVRVPIGLLRDGAFASAVRAPYGQCIEIPDGLDLVAAALAEPLTISEHAVQDGDVGDGSRVLVFGPGTIGQGAAVLARKAGASEVVVVGYKDETRFDVLRKLGFDRLIDLAEPGGNERVLEAAGDGFDCVIEASGANAALELGLQALRMRGVLVAVGIHGRNPSFDINKLVRRRLQIRGSYRASHAIWERVIGLLADDQAAFLPMITHRLPLEEALEGFRLGHRREASKVVLLPNSK